MDSKQKSTEDQASSPFGSEPFYENDNPIKKANALMTLPPKGHTFQLESTFNMPSFKTECPKLKSFLFYVEGLPVNFSK